MGGCGYPRNTKTALLRNDSLIVQSRITQVGLCKRMNHLYTTHLIEKELLQDYKNIGFTKEVVVDWR